MDGGGLSTTATVTANIERNLYPPELLKRTYKKTIFENEPLSAPLITIQAKDQDANVCYVYIFISCVPCHGNYIYISAL